MSKRSIVNDAYLSVGHHDILYAQVTSDSAPHQYSYYHILIRRSGKNWTTSTTGKMANQSLIGRYEHLKNRPKADEALYVIIRLEGLSNL